MLYGRLGPGHDVPAEFFVFDLGMVDFVLRAAADSAEVNKSVFPCLLFIKFNFKSVLLAFVCFVFFNMPWWIRSGPVTFRLGCANTPVTRALGPVDRVTYLGNSFSAWAMGCGSSNIAPP